MEKFKNMLPLNWGLLSNPVNWVIVFLMVAVAGVALALLFKSAGGTAAISTATEE